MTLHAHGESSARAEARVFDYDIFVVHAAADEPFVQGYLLPELGLAPDRILVQGTLRLGRLLLEEIERGVRSSRFTIVVLSPAYMTDHWAVFGEQLAAYASVAHDVRGSLLPLWLEDCQLPTHIQALVKLDFRESAPEVWNAEAARLRRELDQPATANSELPCPYPGMRPFHESEAARFFGRDAELDDLLRRLRRGERELYVIGASGSGKSSLIAAGLVPKLTRGTPGLPGFLVRTLRPGERPLERLAEKLEGDLAAPSAAVGELLARHAPANSLLLVIDQLEELFAVAGADQRVGFIAAVRLLRADPRCVLIFTLRADFYGAFMESLLWGDLDGRISRIDLGALGGDSLRAVIERPARDLGVHFQPELVARLLGDADREPGTLPLLQEALFQLWGRRRHRLLALADYHALGDGARSGLAFAIAEHAGAVLRSLTRAQEAIAFRILLRLVTFGEGRADTRRQQPRVALRSEGEPVADFDAVLQRLVDNRLVTVTGDDQHGDVRVDLAHEVLIHAWPSFADRIKTWRAHEQRRRDLEAAAAAWRARGGGDGGLLDAVEFAFAIAWRAEAAYQLGHSLDLSRFLAASDAIQARAAGQRRRRARLAFAGITLFALVTSTLSLIAFGQRHSAMEQGHERDRLLTESSQFYEETGRQLLEAERPLKALPYLVAAREAREVGGGESSPSLRMLFEQATRNLPISHPLQHHGLVNSAAFSPDGTRVVTASWDRTARVWDAATGKPLSPPLQHSDRLVSAAFSPDGTRVVTASEDSTARVWDAATGKPLSRSFQHEFGVVSAAFSPDGTRVVTACGGKTARIWDAVSGKLLSRLLEDQGSVVSAAFSPDGTRVVTASGDRTARIWDAVTGKPLSRPLEHQGRVVSAVFSPDGTRVVTASEDHTARVWDVVTGMLLSRPLQHQGSVVSAAFSPDGIRVVTASSDHTARVWDAATGEPLSTPLEHHDRLVSAAFSPDGTRVVTASWDNTARVWNSATGKLPSPLIKHPSHVNSAAFSPDGTRVVTASWDHTARVWDATTGRPLLRPLQHQGSVVGAAFSPDGTRVVTASEDHTAHVWDATTGKPLSRPLEHQDAVKSAAFSSDGSRVVTASSDHTARVWDAATGKPLSRPLEHQDTVNSAVFSPDGSRVVTASSDHTARVWDAVTGKPLSPPLHHQFGVRNATFSPDGGRVVTASWDLTARIWDAVTGQPLSPPLRHQGAVHSAAFSPDGGRVVTASWDFTARIWDAATGQPLSPPLYHQDVVQNATFSSDGTRVITASWDHTARVWDAATGTLLSPPLQHQRGVSSAVFSPDGTHLVTASDDQTARVWDAATGKPLSLPIGHPGYVVIGSFGSDGNPVIIAKWNDTKGEWDRPLTAGTLADWRVLAEGASPYVLVNGRLALRSDDGEQASSNVPAP